MSLRIPFSLDLSSDATYDGREGEDALRGSACASFFACDNQYRDDHWTDAYRRGAASPDQLRRVFLYYDLHVFGACFERLQRAVYFLEEISWVSLNLALESGLLRGATISIQE